MLLDIQFLLGIMDRYSKQTESILKSQTLASLKEINFLSNAWKPLAFPKIISLTSHTL